MTRYSSWHFPICQKLGLYALLRTSFGSASSLALWHAVAGAVGAIFYTEAFSTRDIDFLATLPHRMDPLGPIRDWLRAQGHKAQFTPDGEIMIGIWPVHFLPTEDAFSSEALAKAGYLPYEQGVNVRVVLPEYLAAEAVKLGRPKDVQRVAMLMEVDEFDPDRFDDLINRFGLQAKWEKMRTRLGEDESSVSP